MAGPPTERISVEISEPISRARGTETDPSVTFHAPEFDEDTTIGLNPALDFVHEAGDFLVFANADSSLASYVKSTPSGGQAIYALGNATVGSGVELDLPIAPSAVLEPAGSQPGYFIELESGASIYLHPAVAKDARGHDLTTQFRLEGNRLVQDVVAPVGTVYPILAAPTWWYTVDYGIGTRTPASARATMKSCFNCKFPVEGAPSAFPVAGQLLPLKVGPFAGYPWPLNFECKFRNEAWRPYPADMGGPMWGFVFDGTSNHVDGYGSWISFDTFKKDNESTYTLRVYGEIVNNDPGGIPHNLYITGATLNWNAFAGKLKL
ncbi:hypothetical protein GCM10027056_30410 [Glaciibacter psychrotolerans]